MGTQSDVDDAYDAFQPCFFPEYDMDVEFYDAPAPSEDIWKKFELLPTPPRSPKHESHSNYTLMPSTLDNLQLVSDVLEEESRCKCVMLSKEDCDDISCLKSNLIQDCMWSGLKLNLLDGTTVPCDKSVKDSNNNSTGSDSHSCCGSNSTSLSSSIDINASTDCVDPAAVFPYPLNQPSRKEQSHSLGTETPSDSEDEEIDVVTVNEKVQATKRKPVMPAASSMSAQVAAMHNYSSSSNSYSNSPRTSAQPKASSQQQQRVPTTPKNTDHDCYDSPRNSPASVSHKRSRASSTYSSPTRPALKKIRISLPQPDLKSVVQKLNRHTSYHSYSSHSTGSRSSSDSEDNEGRRAQHNVLERKRRNDLKSSFHRLRDSVPELAAQDKAPKVVILRRASEHITGLKREQKTLLSELEKQKKLHEQLKRKLALLRGID